MVKKIILALAIFSCFIYPLFASPLEEIIEKTFQIASSKTEPALDEKTEATKNENKQVSVPEEKIEIPEWVRRTNFAIEVGTDAKPKYFLETIQPLFGTQNKDIVLFNQSRISEKDYRPTYNIGFGLRKIFNTSYLLGANTFYDYQDLNKHSRGGVGFEAISDRGLEARLNTYIRISNQRVVKDDGVNEYLEKVANGFDWELGSPLPYLPFLKMYGGGYWYNFEHFKNKYGWKMRMEYNPIKYSRLVFELFDDTKRNKPGCRWEGAITLAFTSFSVRDIINDLKGAKEAFPKINLEDKVLDRVVRDFDITVIKSTKTKATGLTVEGGRT